MKLIKEFGQHLDFLQRQLMTAHPFAINNHSIYHYTNSDGLLGIIQNKEIWATNVKFLNDSSELTYGLNILKVIEQMEIENNTLFAEYKNRENEFRTRGGAQDLSDHYIFCASRSKGKLNQYRNYSGRDGAVCIGFRTSNLINNIKKHSGPYGIACEIAYNEHHQEVIMQDDVAAKLSALSWLIEKFESLDLIPDELISFLINYFIGIERHCCLRCKHSSFEEEDEVRIIFSIPRGENTLKSYRTSPYGIAPFLKLKFWQEKNLAPLAKQFELQDFIDDNPTVHSIDLGPNVHADLYEEAIRDLVKGELSNPVQISSNTIPLRV
ncbi:MULTISPECIES: DUF2971 domain-containing protein [unclassified Pseudovibrio]|uniref:DUF2971 domain-containing protein n=1 Tax=unclassified Pseudovibrio TaxID=2627060 RepID=UPI0007AE3B7A|nr:MULTISPECIES: DUF2971 domain-containing protein [unclassified Pseudovibrio]KZL01086.1 hypothetical protein PsW74_01879 [Pseudovibrio sp. W74]KZL11151.1 hypothetical protein PsAD14_00900 [Pseudovibrio sp. Ad14]